MMNEYLVSFKDLNSVCKKRDTDLLGEKGEFGILSILEIINFVETRKVEFATPKDIESDLDFIESLQSNGLLYISELDEDKLYANMFKSSSWYKYSNSIMNPYVYAAIISILVNSSNCFWSPDIISQYDESI